MFVSFKFLRRLERSFAYLTAILDSHFGQSFWTVLAKIVYLGAEIWVPKDEVHDPNKKLNLTVGWLSTGECLICET